MMSHWLGTAKAAEARVLVGQNQKDQQRRASRVQPEPSAACAASASDIGLQTWPSTAGHLWAEVYAGPEPCD
eukprot:2575403-Lingulodinium_polyedra.AAC.1